MINLCTFPSLTTKQLLDIISTDLIRLLCYCFLGFYWLLGDKSIALKIILWLYITLCTNFHTTELQVWGHFTADPRLSSASLHSGWSHAAVDQELMECGNILILNLTTCYFGSRDALVRLCSLFSVLQGTTLGNVLQHVNIMRKLRKFGRLCQC